MRSPLQPSMKTMFRNACVRVPLPSTSEADLSMSNHKLSVPQLLRGKRTKWLRHLGYERSMAMKQILRQGWGQLLKVL